MINYEVFYNNGYKYPDYAVWCEGSYFTLKEAKEHQPWYKTSVFERIDRVEYDADGFVINRQKNYVREGGNENEVCISCI